MSKPTTYRDAGVDIDEATRMVELIKPIVKTATRKEVLGQIGGFGGLFKLDLSKYKKPLLVAGTDGVGTKLKIAFEANMHHTVGIDLVAMSVNDLIVQGAEPLFFLDYFACGRLEAEQAASVVSGIAEGCRQAGCALIGGETAELPGFYEGGEYDLAGFAVGIVDEDKVIDGSRVSVGDTVFGLASSGLHSNGYSLVRKVIFDNLDYGCDTELPGIGRSVAQELLCPTRIYAKQVLAMAQTGKIKALAHITGGGFYDNIPRVLPDGACAVLKRDSIPTQPIFDFIAEHGPVEPSEMFRTFNMGIGMAVIADPSDFDALKEAAAQEGEQLLEIGRIEATEQAPHVIIE